VSQSIAPPFSLILFSLSLFKSQTTKWVEDPAVKINTLLEEDGLKRKMNSSLIMSTVMEKATGAAFLGQQVFFTRIEVKANILVESDIDRMWILKWNFKKN